MEPDQLKSAWKDIAGKNKNREELKLMIRENRHPTLKGIRMQMIIEITAWTFFLFLYYNMFDGDRKPFYVNLLLVAAVLLLLVHSMMGYVSSKKLVKGNNLKESLLKYFTSIKVYAIVSVTSRVFTIICLLIFFIATIEFTANKYILLAGIAMIIPLQVFLLSRIWIKRIKKIKAAINELSQ